MARTQPRDSALVTADQAEAIRNALKSSLYPGASDGSVDMVLSYCKAAGLDPMTKPVHIVPMKVSSGRKDERGFDIKEDRDVVMPGIGLYRINAARTGLYAGCSEPEFGPTMTMESTRDVWVDGDNGRRRKTQQPFSMSYPEWCRVTVRKLLGSQIVEFSAKEYWLENYASKGDGSPNAMWEKRAFGQLAKCAEAQALRKAFPEAVGSQPTAEEMEGKTLDGEATIVAQPMPAALPEYPAADFEKNLAMWRGVIESGRKTADEIVAMVSSKGRLSDEQLKKIRAPFEAAQETTDTTKQAADEAPIDWNDDQQESRA